MTEAERPYFYEPIDRLEVVVEHYAGDVAVWKDICVEFLHRNTRRARSLRVSAFANLMRSMSDYFEWPDTEAPGGDGSVDETYFNHDRGVLGFLGYSVGRTGIPVQARRDLLDQAFLGQLPKINSAEYMLEWGDRGTAGRLRKIAESIAAFARNAKRRRSGSMSEAIADWESDLEYLRVKHYERSLASRGQPRGPNFTWSGRAASAAASSTLIAARRSTKRSASSKVVAYGNALVSHLLCSYNNACASSSIQGRTR